MNERDKAILLGAAGAGVVLYAMVRREAAVKRIDCSDVANRVGGTVAQPCPTTGPVDVCTQNDYDAWQHRIDLQLHAVTVLYARLDQYGLLDDPQLEQSLRAYISSASAAVQSSNPIWTTETDINPMAALVGTGCELLNAGNRRLVDAGFRDQVVQEAGETVQYAELGRKKSPTLPGWAKVGIVAGGAIVLASLLRRR